MSQAPDEQQHIAVFTPYLQGFYLGEIVDQIRQLCSLQNYKFTAIRTDSFGTFGLPLGITHFTGVILLRNAVSSELAERLLTSGIPVVSVAYDYYPLEIPVLGCDNQQAIELAYDYLLNKGHKKIAYVGDLSQYDLRKRYEYFCAICDEKSDEEDAADNFYSAPNSLYRGGINAAKAFLKKGDNTTGVICGAGLTALGFSSKISKSNREIDIVGFDATAITPIYAPKMVSIDQNLHLIAHRAMDVLKAIKSGTHVNHEELVQARLITPSDDFEQSREDYMLTCTEKHIFANPNYAKSLITNNYEWTKLIIESNLDELMSIYPVFRDFMQTAMLSRTKSKANGEMTCIITRAYTESETVNLVETGATIQFDADIYPTDKNTSHVYLDGAITTHFPITVGSQLWGVLSLAGPENKVNTACSYMGFTSYVDTIVQNLSHILRAKQAKSENN